MSATLASVGAGSIDSVLRSTVPVRVSIVRVHLSPLSRHRSFSGFNLGKPRRPSARLEGDGIGREKCPTVKIQSPTFERWASRQFILNCPNPLAGRRNRIASGAKTPDFSVFLV